MKKLRTKAKGFLALLMTLVMLLGVCLPTAALGVTVPEDATYDDLCWSLTYEDGKIRFKINPDVVYEILKDKTLSKNELKALIPQEILDTLEKGKSVTVDDLTALASNYVTAEELKAIVSDMPKELVSEFLDLDLLNKLVTAEELMDLLPLDDIVNSISEDAIKSLLTDEVKDIMFKDEVIEAVVSDEYVSKIINETTLVDDILQDTVIKAKLVDLVTTEVINQMLADPVVGPKLEAYVGGGEIGYEILHGTTGDKTNLEIIFDHITAPEKQTLLDRFILAVEDKLLTKENILNEHVIGDLISAHVIDHTVITTVFTNAELRQLMDDTVIDALLADDTFVDGVANNEKIIDVAMSNNSILDKIITKTLINDLAGITSVKQTIIDEIYEAKLFGYDDVAHLDIIDETKIKNMLSTSGVTASEAMEKGILTVTNEFTANSLKALVLVNCGNVEEDANLAIAEAIATVKGITVPEVAADPSIAENLTVTEKQAVVNRLIDGNYLTLNQLSNTPGITFDADEFVNFVTTEKNVEIKVENILKDGTDVLAEVLSDNTLTTKLINFVKTNADIKAAITNNAEATAKIKNAILGNPEVKSAVLDEFKSLLETDNDFFTEFVNGLDPYFDIIAAKISVTKVVDILSHADHVEQKFQNLMNQFSDHTVIIHALSHDTMLELLGNNQALFDDEEIIGEFLEIFDPMNDTVLLNEFGGINSLISKYADMNYVITDVVGASNITKFFDTNALIEIIGFDTILDNYVDIKDVIAEAGGPAELAKMYSNDELKAIFEAIGTDKLKAFVEESGILDSIDFKAILSDLIDMLKPRLKNAAKEIFDTAIRVMNTKFDGIYLNGTKIFNGAQFDITAILVSLIDMIPDTEEFCSLGVDGVIFDATLRLDVYGADGNVNSYEYGFNASFNGDPSNLISLVEDYADSFKLDVDENLNIDVYVALPEVVSSIYETALTHEKVPQSVKNALVLLPNKTVGELKDTLEGILTNDELYDAIYEKLDDIKAKAYDKINERFGDKDVVAKAQAKVDELLDKFATKENYDKVVDKALALADKVTSSFDASLPIQKLYDGNGQFSFSADLSFDFIEALNKIVSKYIAIPEEVVVLFTSTEISASLDATVVVDGLYQLTVIDEYGDEFITYLPAGISLDVLKDANGMTVVDDNAEAVTEMPAEDCVLNSSLRYYVEFVIGDTVVYREFYNIGDTTVTEPDLKSDEYTQYIENYNPYEYIYSWEDYTLGEQKVTTVKMVTTDAYEYTYVTFVDEDGNVLEYVKDGEIVKAEKVEFAYGAEESEILAFAKTLTASANKVVTINGYVQFATDATYTNEQTVTVLYDVKKITLNVTFDSTPEDAKPAYKTENAVSLLSTTGDTDTLSVPYGATLEEIQKLIKDTYLVGKVSNPDNYLIIVNGYSAGADSDVAQNITVTYKLATLSLTVNDVAGGTTAALVKDYSYSDYANYAEMLAAINADVAEHFTKTGHTASLAKFEEAAADTQTVTYTANKYKAEFYVDDVLYKTVEFTYGAESIDAPAVPDKTGYTGAWDKAYKKGDMDIRIDAEYTANRYNVKWYMDDSKTELIQEKTWEFANSSTYPSHPADPTREGYTFKGWSITTLDFTKAGDIEVWATWESKTPVTPPDEPDEPTDPSDSGSSTEPDYTTSPDGTDTEEPSFFDTTGKYFLWIGLLLILILVAAGIVVYINKSRKDNEPEPTPDPEPTPEPEAEPEAEPEVEEEPEVEVEEELHTVDHVSAEEADSMMSDSDAMKLVVTKKAAVVAGQKAIINLSTINSKFEAGETVNIEALKAKKLIPAKTTKLKVLGSGNVDKPLNVEAHAFSLQAVKMITLTGGTATQIVSE